jgi:hypothetical protein
MSDYFEEVKIVLETPEESDSMTAELEVDESK